jgi:hypothetical protein
MKIFYIQEWKNNSDVDTGMGRRFLGQIDDNGQKVSSSD